MLLFFVVKFIPVFIHYQNLCIYCSVEIHR